MLNCRKVTEQASDHLHELPEGLYGLRIRFHLLICEHCRRFRRHMLNSGTTASRLAKKLWLTEADEADQILRKISEQKDRDT